MSISYLINDPSDDTSDKPTHVPSTAPSITLSDTHINAPTQILRKLPSMDPNLTKIF